MASTKNRVIAGDYEKKKVALKSTLTGKKAVIKAGYIKVIYLDKKTVASYEVLDESSALSRKVKEVAIAQKQKERDFIQAKRAIERIRMAI